MMSEPANPSKWGLLGIEPGLVLRVSGMRRSGNHAVINWLIRNVPGGRSVFLNNCVPGRNPLKTYRNIEINGAGCGGGENELQECAAQAGEGATLLFSFEDAVPGQPNLRDISPGIGAADVDWDIVVYRGFLNWSASLVRKLRRNPGYNAVQRTNVMLRAIDLYGAILALVGPGRTQRSTPICYDDWVEDDAYRAGILESLGFAIRDNCLGKVQRYGGGSSFEGHTDHVAPQDVRQRWKQMASDAEYQIVLWLAAQDEAFVERLKLVFPVDAEMLEAVARGAVISTPISQVEAAP